MSGRRRPRVGVFGILGSGNLGNDGSLEATMRWLRRDHADAEVGFMCMGTETVSRRYGGRVTALQWFEGHAPTRSGIAGQGFKVLGRLLLDPVRTLLWVRRQDVVVIPGMGVLETTTPVRPWAFPWSMTCLAVAARLTRTPVALVSIGANVISQRSTRRLVTLTGRLVAYRSFRDEFSRDAMGRMGVDVSGDQIFPDLAFSLPDGSGDGGGPDDRIAVGLMAYVGGNDDRHRAEELHERYLACMRQFVTGLLQEGREVVLFSGDDEDAPIVADVREHALAQLPGLEPGRLTVLDVDTLPGLLEELARSGAVVASRYHNVLGALSVSRPTVSVGYAAKHEALMTGLGVPEYSLSAATVDVELLRKTLAVLLENREDVVARLTRANRRLRDELDRQFAELSATLFR